MHNDLWVLDVLRDIGVFASNRGYFRLMAAMETASDDFLTDVRETKAEFPYRTDADAEDIAFRQALMPLLKKSRH